MDKLKKMENHRANNLYALVIRSLLNVSRAFSIGILVFIVMFILIKGLPFVTKDLFEFEYTSRNVSMMPSIITTVLLVIAVLAISLVFGIFSAIYLVEYAKKDSLTVKLVTVVTETLSGIPSIVYGLFGNIFFVHWLGMGYCFLAGALTLSIMVLPLIMRTTQEALLSVPQDYRSASFGLGRGKLHTVFKIVLPRAANGILSGVILATGRAVGETAALIYTLGTATGLPEGLFSSGRTLALHMWRLSGEGLHISQAYATAVVLIFIVIIINAVSDFLAAKVKKG